MLGNRSDVLVDSGCTLSAAIDALKEFGTCLESTWPYHVFQVNIEPEEQAYEQAAYHQIHKAQRLRVDLVQMKSCLARGFPFAFGLRLYRSFDAAAQTGVVPTPDISNDCHSFYGRYDASYSSTTEPYFVLVMQCWPLATAISCTLLSSAIPGA